MNIDQVVQEHGLLLTHGAGNWGLSYLSSVLIPAAFLCICDHSYYETRVLKKSNHI